MLQTVDLFSGIGGFSRGLEATGFFKTTRFVENDPYCQAVLRYHWPDIPVLGDIKSARRPDFPERTDLVCGGFPCQPFSQAGKQQAQDDPRHLWPEMFRLIRECRPTWVVGENVVGLIRLGLDEVLADLESEGYSTRTFNIPACSVGAPHLRQRLWIVAHSDSESEPDGSFDGNAGQRQLGFEFVGNTQHNGLSPSKVSGGLLNQSKKQKGKNKIRKPAGTSGTSAHVADSKSKRHGGRGGKERGTKQGVVLSKKSKGRTVGREAEGCGESYRTEQWWEVEPNVGRLVDGLPNRVPQLRALGNSIIPQIAEKIGQAIKETYDVY